MGQEQHGGQGTEPEVPDQEALGLRSGSPSLDGVGPLQADEDGKKEPGAEAVLRSLVERLQRGRGRGPQVGQDTDPQKDCPDDDRAAGVGRVALHLAWDERSTSE